MDIDGVEYLFDDEKKLVALREKFHLQKGLSKQEVGQLNSISNRYTPSAINRRQKWIDSYGVRKQEIARICAEYYIRMWRRTKDGRLRRRRGTTTDFMKYSYYSSSLYELAFSVRQIPNKILSKRQYKKLCESPQSKELLVEVRSLSKYKPGSIVEFRKGFVAMVDLGEYVSANKMATVIVANSSGITSSKPQGSKKYKVLPFGHTKMIEVEEKNIKQYKK